MRVFPKRAVDFTDEDEIRGTRLVMVSNETRMPKDPHQRNRLIGRGDAYCYKEESQVEIIQP
ncbi:hypothetical protein AKJ51_00050 [candidate division MSBL1 archaeon SCGC-AAA382A20]|uniref:Uncharacterized protein n=1 Tax=candidate division MSBL1 archaeon SCGC-AAA382A20 TaxID=1698280 RepID=A0A133VMS8_9EURY|nr:hypothetical protein AKJ51_00050 [candidate division MSBL1 archaeon SCGC-AAA382A20]